MGKKAMHTPTLNSGCVMFRITTYGIIALPNREARQGVTMSARRRQPSNFPLALIALGLLLILGAGGWYLYQVLNADETVQPVPPVEEDFPDVPRVSLADARAAYETSGAVFLDVRDAESYAQNHIAGAISIPLNELPDRMGELNKSDWIITYCT
jgi:hypothetical protein